MKIPFTITIYVKIDGEIYSEVKNSFVLKEGAAPKVDIRAILEHTKNEIKSLANAEQVEFITQEEYEEYGD